MEGDPEGKLLVGLWAYVAEGVAAYSELTAAEAYLGTASDWTDLRRLAALVGYKPRPRIASQGWVRADVDRGSDPVVPAGTRVQAPGTPARPAQTFEVVEDTQLRAEWNDLTATWVPTPAVPSGREVRFLGDPGFRAGDRVLFVNEQPDVPTAPASPAWVDWWAWYTYLLKALGYGTATEPVAVATVVERRAELGTVVVGFDRELGSLLSDPTKVYAAYRVVATAGVAQRLEKILRVTGEAVASSDISDQYASAPAPVTGTSLVLDTAIEIAVCRPGRRRRRVDHDALRHRPGRAPRPGGLGRRSRDGYPRLSGRLRGDVDHAVLADRAR